MNSKFFQRCAASIVATLPTTQELTRKTTVRFNYYVRREGDRIALYYVPALQPDGKLAYGIEHTYFLDREGRKVVGHEQHGTQLIGAIPSRQFRVTIELTDCEVPTPQALFTMMNSGSRFASILTHCRDGYFGVANEKGVLTCIREAGP